ncbi:MAG: carbon storage regulator CsrA [Candidatus Krumholzibacteriia bacterium]|nr:carbon storage regulator CsrA [bacterium]MCB9515219.1 carbon storage regulator CsrA [Candidatus Latescibacterota bacterium]
MLVLSRKRDQSIIVGEEIKITVVDVRGDTVQLGIDAPRAIAIYREEIYAAIRAANEEAAERQGLDDDGAGPATPPRRA